MSEEDKSVIGTEERERAKLLVQIDEVTAKIQQKIAALLAHPNVPEDFKAQLERIQGEVV